ncbi:hypothetical protein Tco_0679392 [Tanacetum coccineum]|uniref:Uncharacterized protein n=1 Tax=Tanacetum coccineum TaxID=301880 RepID=A0ABQ4XHP9_9ASTR
MDSQIISLNKELQDIRNKYNEHREGNASKNHLNDDTPMCECHEANYIQSEGYHNRNSHDLFSRQSHYDPNDSEKSLTKLNNDVKNDLEDFKRRIRSMRTVYWRLYDRDDRKTTSVLPNKESKTINQEPQSKTDFEKSITKFLDGQRVTNMTDPPPPPPPQAHTEHVNAVFTGSEKSDYSLKTQKDPPPPIIVNNKTEKDCPIKTSKGNYHMVKTNEYPFQCFELCGCVRWKPSRDYNSSTQDTEGFKGLLHALNATVVPRKHSLLVLRSPKYPKSKKNMLDEEEVLCQP